MNRIPVIETILFILRHQWVTFSAGVFIGMIIPPVIFRLTMELWRLLKTK